VRQRVATVWDVRTQDTRRYLEQAELRCYTTSQQTCANWGRAVEFHSKGAGCSFRASPRPPLRRSRNAAPCENLRSGPRTDGRHRKPGNPQSVTAVLAPFGRADREPGDRRSGLRVGEELLPESFGGWFVYCNEARTFGEAIERHRRATWHHQPLANVTLERGARRNLALQAATRQPYRDRNCRRHRPTHSLKILKNER
jgi:hypothetical protein